MMSLVAAAFAAIVASRSVHDRWIGRHALACGARSDVVVTLNVVACAEVAPASSEAATSADTTIAREWNARRIRPGSESNPGPAVKRQPRGSLPGSLMSPSSGSSSLGSSPNTTSPSFTRWPPRRRGSAMIWSGELSSESLPLFMPK